MKTRSWLRTKLSQAFPKRSGCLLLSKHTKHKQKQKHKVSTPKVPSQRRSTPLEPNFHTLQMSGRPMGAQSRGPGAAGMMNPSSRGHATSAPSEQSTPPRGLGAAYLTPTCGDTCHMCERRACQVTTPHDDHVCFACEQQILRQRQRFDAESPVGSALRGSVTP